MRGLGDNHWSGNLVDNFLASSQSPQDLDFDRTLLPTPLRSYNSAAEVVAETAAGVAVALVAAAAAAAAGAAAAIGTEVDNPLPHDTP